MSFGRKDNATFTWSTRPGSSLHDVILPPARAPVLFRLCTCSGRYDLRKCSWCSSCLEAVAGQPWQSVALGGLGFGTPPPFDWLRHCGTTSSLPCDCIPAEAWCVMDSFLFSVCLFVSSACTSTLSTPSFSDITTYFVSHGHRTDALLINQYSTPLIDSDQWACESANRQTIHDLDCWFLVNRSTPR